MTDLANKVKTLIRNVPNFPKKGIIFKDITPVLKDATTFTRIVGALEAYGRKRGTELVAGIESRGFLFGAAVAARLEVGLIPIRKLGKLPWKTVKQSYKLEYGTDTMEIHKDAVKKGQRVLIVDDVLATGGTLIGACKLVEKVGGKVAGTTCLLELTFLKGLKKLGERDFYSIVQY
ncbi:MAG TPA: adenine phosphoribosyltransferase [Planctomycetota bacterium]|jgi:adenine phosphoribosyltransferase|nr:adenine phosphoribosyltransferase [Planctomycetota bacterium]